MKFIAFQLRKFFLLKYFMFGLSIAFLMHASGSCSKDSSNPVNPNNKDNVDMEKINEGAKLVETAFISGDVNSIKNILTDNAKELYGVDLPQVNKVNLVKLGEALKTRELKVYTDLYAEYNYTKDGVVYSISMAQQEDGSWKLMRF